MIETHSSAFGWREKALADYQLARTFADQFGARVPRMAAAQRIVWGDDPEHGFGIVLPDLLQPSDLIDDEWYIYNVEMDTITRHTQTARELSKAILLPGNVNDWVDLLRLAVRDKVFNLRYEVNPTYIDDLGEIELEAVGYVVKIHAYAPHALSHSDFEISAVGETPEIAARECCHLWLVGKDAEGSTAA